ncbi:MAG: SDR family NAD(P)-dependent oxidoreductase [Actinobacteria bacterium]|nr:SDR family NAD(P)-dependent oxidoreductase [Actinomycetota bacterium]
MTWNESDIPSLNGKVALITGANSGLGLAAATTLAKHGARVVMACRNAAKAEAAADRVRASATGPVEVVSLDLASLASVDACATSFMQNEPKLDLLLNNAGLMAIDEARTEDDFEMQLGVNHLGHFALTAKLAPLVFATPGSRIVNMASFGHRPGRLHIDDLFFDKRGYDRWRPYFQSKLANILFTLELHRRLQASGVATKSLAAHPGGSKTDLGFEGKGITNAGMRPAQLFLQSAHAGAMPFVRAAVDPAANSGEFYGPALMMWGPARKETPSKHARNAEDARALWEKSAELTGVEFAVFA